MQESYNNTGVLLPLRNETDRKMPSNTYVLNPFLRFVRKPGIWRRIRYDIK